MAGQMVEGRGVFAAATEVRAVEDGGLAVTLDRRFEIWGPNGGYLSAIALRAAGRAVPSGHRPVSISVQYVSRAAFAEAEVCVELVKPGRSTLAFVAMRQEGRTFLTAQVWTSDRDEGPVAQALAMPEVPPPGELAPLGEHLRRAGRAENPFWQHFDVRPVDWHEGANPEGPRLRQWFRYRDLAVGEDAYIDAGRALLLIDTLVWPAHCRGLDEPPAYLAPSLDVAAWFHARASGEWLLLDVAADIAREGAIHGTVRVWDEGGRLVASGASGLAVLPPRNR